MLQKNDTKEPLSKSIDIERCLIGDVASYTSSITFWAVEILHTGVSTVLDGPPRGLAETTRR